MDDSQVTLRILFFATLRDLAGGKELSLALPGGSTLGELRAALVAQIPALAERLPTALAAINKEYAFDQDELPAGAEVAFFPPVSGGQTDNLPGIFSITEDELDLDDLLAQITLPATGAAAIFTGMVRGVTTRDHPHETVYLEYEAYRPMAEAKMRQVADEIRARWPSVQGIAIVQRVGKLYPRTPTVLIACTSAHRDTGVFDAARYGIDRLKEIVPVWKKEVGPNGEEWVEGDYLPTQDD
jgi:molybdopterin synthase catalytic subunit